MSETLKKILEQWNIKEILQSFNIIQAYTSYFNKSIEQFN
ncbi:hypothetical protein VN0834_14920 [Helicobacter pylori]